MLPQPFYIHKALSYEDACFELSLDQTACLVAKPIPATTQSTRRPGVSGAKDRGPGLDLAGVGQARLGLALLMPLVTWHGLRPYMNLDGKQACRSRNSAASCISVEKSHAGRTSARTLFVYST